ncbi:MAG: GNAT family N-acetyltransferase [Bifidobacteriaceae bacterium]|jgi:predicted GNAT family N-acyltransferase|nr:GNAT family N-acetyltransferase [Bifidobacteriaceae bacterium]
MIASVGLIGGDERYTSPLVEVARQLGFVVTPRMDDDGTPGGGEAADGGATAGGTGASGPVWPGASVLVGAGDVELPARFPAGLRVIALVNPPDPDRIPASLPDGVEVQVHVPLSKAAWWRVAVGDRVRHVYGYTLDLDEAHPSLVGLIRSRFARALVRFTQAGVWVREATRPTDLADTFDIRWRVFVDEQHVPADEELDVRDATARHVIGHVDGVPCATGRLLPPDDHGAYHLGRVAVLRERRGTGLGRRIVRALERLALDDASAVAGRPVTEVPVALSAQVRAVGFYAHLGYDIGGATYLDAGIEHRDAHRLARLSEFR